MGRHQESRVVSQSHRELADSIQETLLHGRKTREMSSEGEDEDRMGLLPPDWMAHAQASVLMVRRSSLVVWSGGRILTDSHSTIGRCWPRRR